MKKHFTLISFFIFSFLSLSSCCLKSGDLIGTHLITEEMKAKIPYQGEGEVNMIHSQGYEFVANTSFRSKFYSDQEHCEDYHEIEEIDVNFHSELPNITINIRINAYDSEEYFINQIPHITVNNYPFQKELEPINNFAINNINYNNVYRYFTEREGSNVTELFYNYDTGILKLNYKDDSYVQINP